VAREIGVERTFLLHSPVVDSVETVRRGSVRRARLYYLRGLSGRAARIKEARRNSRRSGVGPPDAAACDLFGCAQPSGLKSRVAFTDNRVLQCPGPLDTHSPVMPGAANSR
jgi:hypothetical protein